MRDSRGCQHIVFVFIVIVFLVSWVKAAQLPVVRVGMVHDGPWERNDEVRRLFEQEISDLLRGEFDVRFPEEMRLLADWTLAGVKTHVDRLMADPKVDFILTLGPIASTYAGRLSVLPKPVIATFVLNPELQGIPYHDGVSGVKNLSYVTFPGSLIKELDRFQEIVPFKKITVLVNQGLGDVIPELSTSLLSLIRALDLDPTLIPVGNSVEEALSNVPADTEAIYVFPLIQLPPGEFDRLIAGLNERRLPSFSYWGRGEVERGILASMYLDTDFQRLARRVAVNMQRILLGEDAGALPVAFARSERLTINMATARAIGVYPNWGTLTEAELINEEQTGIQRRITLVAAAQEAITANLDLMTSDRFVAAGEQNIREARSRLFPQVEASAFTQFIDKDRAEAGFGGTPQRVLVGSLGATQLIYSEPVRANIKIQEYLQTSRQEQREQTRLDIVQEATVAYLNVLRAKTFERIQKDNLKLTRSNLELAQSRQEIGVARPSEVIRWENQIANNRRDVIDVRAQRNQAEIALNRLLHRPIEESFVTVETDLDDPSLLTSAKQLAPYIDNPWSFRIFRDFMTQEALALAPELRQFDAGIAAQERALLSAKRAFWSPTVALQADLTAITKGGAGSNISLEFPGPFTFSTPNSVNWTVGISVSLPLFTGGARRAERARAGEELAQLRVERQATVERIEQRIRSALHQAGASFAGIKLAQDAADAARRNLDLVIDAYSRGVVPILDLLDAQTAALVADQVAANAVYDYLIDLMNVHRAVGRFDFFMSPSEQQSFLDRLKAYFEQAGYVPRK